MRFPSLNGGACTKLYMHVIEMIYIFIYAYMNRAIKTVPNEKSFNFEDQREKYRVSNWKESTNENTFFFRRKKNGQEEVLVFVFWTERKKHSVRMNVHDGERLKMKSDSFRLFICLFGKAYSFVAHPTTSSCISRLLNYCHIQIHHLRSQLLPFLFFGRSV